MGLNPELGLFNQVKSFDDYRRLEDEFQMRKQQQMLANELGKAQVEKLKRPEFDIERMAAESIYKSSLGQTLTPQERAAIETKAAMEGQKTTFQTDPEGFVRSVTQPNPYEQFLGGLGQQKMTPPFSPKPMATNVDAQLDSLGSPPPMQNFMPPIPQTSQNMPLQQSQLPNPLMQSPLGRAEQTKALADVQKQEMLRSGDVEQAGAEAFMKKVAEAEASKPKKLAAAARIQDNLRVAESLLRDLPEGAIERFGTYVGSDIFGLPSKQAQALGEVDTLLPVLVSDAKQIVREPGEGTFTDADQRLIQNMFFDPAAPYGVKLAQLRQIDGVMERYRTSLGQDTSKGFKTIKDKYGLE